MSKKKGKKATKAGQHYAGIVHVVYLSTNAGGSCEHCGQRIGFSTLGDTDLATSINHFIEQHGYRLLHVGAETNPDNEGKPHHSTVAVLGATDKLASKPEDPPVSFVEVQRPATDTPAESPEHGKKSKRK
jgi:hypothetical protein